MILKRIEDFKSFRSVDGCEIVEVIGLKTTETKEVSVAYATIKPKQETYPHKHGFTEVYVILQGKGIIYMNSKNKPIRRGDNILIPKGTWHHVKNTGKTNLKIMCICTPAFTEKKTKLKNRNF